MGLGDWLEARVGWRGLLARFGSAPIPGGARWSYVLGALLVFAFALQAVTGVLLASFYAPAATTAWAAVAYLQQEVTLGWLVRGLHSLGASLMVLLALAHLVVVVAWGAHRKPREVTWWLGLMALALVLAFALTGYLLPWDQKGYWATQVATSLVGELPLIGRTLRAVVQGGNDYGNLTLTHFYALHTMLLPVTLTAVVVAHIALVRRHGVANPKGRVATEPLWPRQATRDALAMALLLGLMIARVVQTHGAPLEAPADPSSRYEARPEWYFLPLYQLLKYFPGAWEPLGALGAPLAVVALLVLLPWLRGRNTALALIAGLLLAATALGGRAWQDDANSPAVQRARLAADAEAARALELARQGVPAAGGTAVFANDPAARGRQLFAEHCAGCHRLDGGGEARGPLLTGWSSRAWIADFLVDPDGERYFGRSKRLHDMKPVKASGEELRALVEWVYAEGGGDDVDATLRAAGEKIYARESCDDCHERDGKRGGGGAPNLGGRASVGWTAGLVRNAGGELYFDTRSEMPRFGRDKLDDNDVTALVTLLREQRARRDVTPAQLR